MRFARTGCALVLGLAWVGCARSERALSAAGTPALTPEPLAWTDTEAQAMAALTRAAMAPRADARHAYVSMPAQLHAAPGTIEVAHTVEPIIRYAPRPGWTGTAHYPTVGGALDQVELQGRLAPAAALDALDALTRRLGRPDDERVFAASPPATGATLRRIWVRGGVWLVARAEPEGTITLTYRRDDRPATEIGP